MVTVKGAVPEHCGPDPDRKECTLNATRKIALAAGIASSLVAGAAIGFILLGPATAGASSLPTAPAAPAAAVQSAAIQAAPGGAIPAALPPSVGRAPAFRPALGLPGAVTGTVTGTAGSNESAAHEAAETPAQEAAEANGAPGGGNCPNMGVTGTAVPGGPRRGPGEPGPRPTATATPAT